MLTRDFRQQRRINFLKAAALILCIVLAISAVIIIPQTVHADSKGTVTASALNVRSGPGTSYSSIGLLYNGATVSVVGISNGWAQINYNGKTAYVSAEYIKMNDEAPAAAATSGTATVTASSLNVRTGAGTENSRIGSLARGTSVTVLEKVNGWYKISSGSLTGYVSGEYLKFTDSTAPAPAAAEAAPAAAAASGTATVNASSLNCRTGAGTNYSIITAFPRNTVVTVIERANGWAKVSANGRTGYVCEDYLVYGDNTTKAAPAQTAAPAAETPAGNMTATVNASALYLRTGAGQSYSSITLMSRNTKVTVVEKGSEWSKVTTPSGQTGYASNEYLVFSNAPASAPAATETPAQTSAPAAAETPASNLTGTVTASLLNVRSGAGTTYGIVTQIKNGTQVVVIEKGSSWSKISVNGVTGYVSNDYIKFSDGSAPAVAASAPAAETPAATEAPAAQTEETGYPYTAYVNATSLNLRSGAGTGYTSLGTIPRNAAVTVTGEGGDGWMKVTYNGTNGYVASQYLASQPNANTAVSGSGDAEGYPIPSNLSGSPAQNILAVARSQIGYREGSGNDTKYGKAYGLNYNPWCHMFVWWCARQAGIDSSTIPNIASCTSAVNWFKKNATFHTRGDGYTPQPGDLIYISWYSGDISHVGIVEKVVGSTVYTIEGNTSDRVAARSYNLYSYSIVGYGVPSYNN